MAHLKSLVKTILSCTLLAPLTICIANAGVLLGYDNGSGHDQTGWEWSDDIEYGAKGWIMHSDPDLGAGETFYWGSGPRSLNKTDYGADNDAIIDTANRAPSTATGSSLKVYSLEGSADNQSTWWVWYDGKPLIERGIADDTTDRMSFYLKIEGMAEITKDGGSHSVPTNFHIGTYLCWYGVSRPYGRGDGCPYEGPGNQHYYHYLSVDPGTWVHVLLDRHPTHLRSNQSITIPDNPTASEGKNYFAQLHQMYMEIRSAQTSPTSYNLDEITYYSTNDTPEPNQNDESITSLWIGYWSNADEWRVGFNDRSFADYGDDSSSTFEIKWSLTPITNENYADANLVQAKLYSGANIVGSTDTHAFRRPDSWRSEVFTTFKIPQASIGSASKVYFAIKDISQAGGHVGTQWPWTRADGHDAPTSAIKTIEYNLAAEGLAPKPNPPSGVSIK